MHKQPDNANKTSLERIGCTIRRAFPAWFLWLFVSLFLTSVSLLAWHAFSVFGFRDGQWRTQSNSGPYYDGGQDVLLFPVVVIGAVYSWIRLLFALRVAVGQRNPIGIQKCKKRTSQRTE
jgi:hypothetical protein